MEAFSNINNSSICSTCINEVSCIHRQSFKGKILQCEEFEIENTSEKSQYLKTNNEDDNKNDTENFTGLCKNCDLRKTCKLYSPDRVNWYCEEYL
ncbi:MAG: hypothetical protein PHD97_08975 [Bacteroidales bacterium]|nr:hypothetical protein [Bacteroidales bacterium]